MKKLLVLLLGIITLLLCSCSDPYRSLATQEKVDAADLKAFCSSRKIVTEETKRADAQFDHGKNALATGDSHTAFTNLGQASALYKIAIAEHHASKSSKSIAQLEKELKEGQESLESYQKLLGEVKKRPQTPEVTDETK